MGIALWGYSNMVIFVKVAVRQFLDLENKYIGKDDF